MMILDAKWRKVVINKTREQKVQGSEALGQLLLAAIDISPCKLAIGRVASLLLAKMCDQGHGLLAYK